ncbi:MAG: hypothetical protein MJ211_01565 [Bacteroidales bacterium]|nr:hypothetical protein [Bacteroidales bacterium]
MKTYKPIIYIVISIYSLLLTNCNAQNNNSMFNFFRHEEKGGYKSKQLTTKPLKNVEGKITKMSFFFHNDECANKESQQIYNIEITNDTLSVSITPDQWHNSFKYKVKFSEDIQNKIDSFVKESGLLNFNNYYVKVNGLPLTLDCDFSATFSSGENCYFSFNGGHYQGGMLDSILNFAKNIEKFVEFNPDKCSEYKPPVNPFIGTHKFVYQNKGKSETFIISINNSSSNSNAEIVMFGDFGNEHIKANAAKIYGSGKEKYYININEYFDDSNEKTNNKGDLGAIMYNDNGILTLEPLRIGKKLPEKVILNKIDNN